MKLAIHSENLGSDLWLTDDLKFTSPDGAPVYYVSEIPLLRDKSIDALKAVHLVKRVFPRAKVKS